MSSENTGLTKISNMEERLIKEATGCSDFNQFYAFIITYLCNYLPLLEYATKSLSDSDIARLANFGMTIDKIAWMRLDQIISRFTDLTVKEIAERTGKPKSDLAKSLSSMQALHKMQLGAFTVFLGSLARDFTLHEAMTKFDVLNKIRIWANIFNHFVNFPALAEIYMDDSVIKEAEKDLEDARKKLSGKAGHLDALLVKDWRRSAELSENALLGIDKLLIGPKVHWFEAKIGLEVCKYLIRNDITYIASAIDFNERFIAFLASEMVSISRRAFRDGFTAAGPCPDTKKIMEKRESLSNVKYLDSDTFLAIGIKSKYIAVLPAIFEFYLDGKSQVEREYQSQNGSQGKIWIPIDQDIYALVHFAQSPAKFFFRYHKGICAPKDSLLYHHHVRLKNRLEDLSKKGNSPIGRLELTYQDKIDLHLTDTLKKIGATGFELLIVYGALYGIESLANACGLPTKTEVWSETRLMIAGLLTAKIKPITDSIKRQAKVNGPSNKANFEIDQESEIIKLDKSIEAIQKDFKNAIDELGATGLQDLWELSSKMRSIITSGLPNDEIMERLSEYIEKLRT